MPAVSGHTTDTIQYSQSPGVLQGNLDCFVLQATAMKLDPYLARRIIGRVPVLPISGGPIAIRTSIPRRAGARVKGIMGPDPWHKKTMKPSLGHHLPIANCQSLLTWRVWKDKVETIQFAV
jgi:hypothetical protein